ncbi:MAG: reprolysin-like metallopeptidase, partial [Bacteroidota bacterium]
QVLGESDGTEMSGSICDSSYVCSSVTIDVLVVYTPAARSATGNNAAALEASIAAAVTELNTVNTNSGVQHSYNLVHTEEVTFTESGNASADLGALRSTNDGLMDNIHQLRYVYRADLVALITSSAYCGIGYVQPNPSFFYPDVAFSISGFSCMATNLTFAHEIGHNMGLHHDWYVNSSSTPCSHHHGYVNQNAPAASNRRWRTVMAYNSNCSSVFGFSCRRVPYWSNPNNNMNGDPMGIPIGSLQPSDNAFALNRASCMVAGFSETLTSFPVTYQDWQVNKDGFTINLNWSTTQEINNLGFEIEIRSDSSDAFQRLAFVSGRGNSNEIHQYSYQVRNSLPGKHYFRLKQIDLDGQYTYSSIKEVEIEASNKLYHQVFPNPTHAYAHLAFVLRKTAIYEIDLMDMDGRVVERLYAGELVVGKHEFELNTQSLNPGLYFYSIRSKQDRVLGKLWVLK